jgi:hypothetical protein
MMMESVASPAAKISTSAERPIKVLFISHDAYRAGAELFLLNVIRWIKSHVPFEMQIVLAREGELQPEFEALAQMYRGDKIRRLLKRLVLPFHGSDRRIFLTEAATRVGREFRPDVIYANTVTVAHVVSRLLPLRAPVLTHVHELDSRLRYRLGAEGFSLLAA